VDTPSGQRARLNNLGYFAGFTDRDQDQLEWAIEEFQADEKLPDRGLKGTLAKDRPTLNRLAERHGDMLKGEEL
jgi:peptidoglycan hydrolase-like protein with peptidoglycan-binding domain